MCFFVVELRLSGLLAHPCGICCVLLLWVAFIVLGVGLTCLGSPCLLRVLHAAL
jgi:hypothetical protein